MEDPEELRIETCKTGMARIWLMLKESPAEAPSYLNFARSIIRSLDMTGFMWDPSRVDDQIWMVEDMQRLAFYDPDSGGVQDLATWCQIQWLKMLFNPQSQIAALIGLGHSWLMKAQRFLAIIHREDASTSSGTSNDVTSPSAVSYTQQDDDVDHEQAVSEATARLHTANYVEARALLEPATDFLSRAVRAADRENRLTGALLTLAAEAFMSLGNVSYHNVAEVYLAEALRYLRRASQLPAYVLTPHLQKYLDDYGRFID